jgi:hypothetical protein
LRLSQNYRQQGLAVASLAIDDLDDQAKVLEFLRAQQADFPNFISAYGGSDGRAMAKFEISSVFRSMNYRIAQRQNWRFRLRSSAI